MLEMLIEHCRVDRNLCEAKFSLTAAEGIEPTHDRAYIKGCSCFLIYIKRAVDIAEWAVDFSEVYGAYNLP